MTEFIKISLRLPLAMHEKAKERAKALLGRPDLSDYFRHLAAKDAGANERERAGG